MANSAPLQQGKKSAWHLELPRLIAGLVLNPGALSIGCTRTGEGWGLVIVQADRSGECRPVAWGNGIPFFIRMLFPMTVYADLGMVPVHFVTAELDGEDPDAWIDRNEERLTPAGFTSDQITTESVVEEGVLSSVTVVTEALNRAVEELENANLPAASLLPPLVGLAELYRTSIKQPFILWYVNEHGSVLGRVEQGNVQNLCHFWADTDALSDNPDEITAAAQELAGSMCGERDACRKFILTTGNLPPGFSKNGGDNRFVPLPQVQPTLPQRLYSAYGNACCGDTALNLLPFHLRQQRRRLHRTFRGVLQACRILFLLLAVSSLVLGSYIGISKLLLLRDDSAMNTVNQQYAELTRAEHCGDSLRQIFARQSGLIGNESTITRLLGDLQLVFPEGGKAEEIAVTEQTADSWKVSVRAFTVSSSLLQPTVENFRNVPGCSGVRVAYSEQVREKKGKGGIRFKLETEWK